MSEVLTPGPEAAAARAYHPDVPPEAVPELGPIVIEDGTPMDSVLNEKQLRLLTEALYASWPGPGGGRPWQVFANVGLFYSAGQASLAPDVMLSLDIRPGPDMADKESRSYFVWLRGKVPEVVVEVVSDRRGDELGDKMTTYASWGVPYYAVFDPLDHLGVGPLRAFRLIEGEYQPLEAAWFSRVRLGLTLWSGHYEGARLQWLRWCDADGTVYPTGRERIEQLEARLRDLGQQP